jgi:hypothetical protein
MLACINLTWKFLDYKMFGFNSTLSKQHKQPVASFMTAAERLCVGYWAITGLNTSIEQDPMKTASFYKESRN